MKNVTHAERPVGFEAHRLAEHRSPADPQVLEARQQLISARLAALIERSPLSQAELAELSGLSQSKISRLASEEVNSIPFANFAALLSALEVDFNSLFNLGR